MLLRTTSYDQETRRLSKPQVILCSTFCFSVFRVVWSSSPHLGLFVKPLQVSVDQQGRLSLTIPEKSTENNFPSLFFPIELGFLFQGLLPHQVRIELGSITAFLISGVMLKVIDLKFLLFLIHAISGY